MWEKFSFCFSFKAHVGFLRGQHLSLGGCLRFNTENKWHVLEKRWKCECVKCVIWQVSLRAFVWEESEGAHVSACRLTSWASAKVSRPCLHICPQADLLYEQLNQPLQCANNFEIRVRRRWGAPVSACRVCLQTESWCLKPMEAR